jgi:hypothetical protein
MSPASDRPGPARGGRGVRPSRTAAVRTPEGRAAKKKELTQRLFGCFLQAVERGETFEWRALLDELEKSLWAEALKLTGGNGREAAALIGIPYSTFMNHFHPHPRAEKDPGPKPESGH